MSDRKRAAFFDLDNTLIKGSSFFYFVKGLVDRGALSKRQVARFSWEHAKFIRRGEENSNIVADATRRALTLISGRSHSAMLAICEEIVLDFLPKKLFPEMKNRIEEHQFLEDDTWLITAAPSEIADVIAKQLGMTGAIGTKSRVTNGIYSGDLASTAMHGPEKAKAIKEIAFKNNYNLDRSFAYSDSLNDLPMLVSVGNPHAVNPEKDLIRIAQKNKWPLLLSA